MKITPTPDGGQFFQPESENDAKVLRDLIEKGYLKAAPPENAPKVEIEIDFLQAFYPDNPEGARNYFSETLNLNGKKNT